MYLLVSIFCALSSPHSPQLSSQEETTDLLSFSVVLVAHVPLLPECWSRKAVDSVLPLWGLGETVFCVAPSVFPGTLGSKALPAVLDLLWEEVHVTYTRRHLQNVCSFFPASLHLSSPSYPWPSGWCSDDGARFSVVLDLTMWLPGMSKTWFRQAPWNVAQLSTAWQAAEA